MKRIWRSGEGEEWQIVDYAKRQWKLKVGRDEKS
jgi:hypothetical protein